jgi:hypothetical protein
MPAKAIVVISAQWTQNMNCSGGLCTPTATVASLNVTDLQSLLASADTTVVAGSNASDIAIVAALTWPTAYRLTLDAYRSIAVWAPVVVTGHGKLSLYQPWRIRR